MSTMSLRRRGKKSNEDPVSESDEPSSYSDQRKPYEASDEANGGGVHEDINASYQPPPNENLHNLENEDKDEGDVLKADDLKDAANEVRDQNNDEDKNDGGPQQPDHACLKEDEGVQCPQHECLREDKSIQCDILPRSPKFPTTREVVILIVAVLSLLGLGILIWLAGSDWSSNDCMERCKMDKDELYNKTETCIINRRRDLYKFNITDYKRNTTIKQLEYQQNETQKAYTQCIKDLEQKNKTHKRCEEDKKLCIDTKEIDINRCREDQKQLKKEHESCNEGFKLCETTKEEYAMSHDTCIKEKRSQYIELENCKTHWDGINKALIKCQRQTGGSYSATSSSSVIITIIFSIMIIFWIFV
ncbi:PREDICTED: uncharacterized protein LOC109580296 [Amphimedon queenslandica]|uniref:Uncharacterized protein n=1 Tax=Amphimedon queenslandica TaxID=400682 RepID=A0AAN0IVQ6_AMPQE|nr:PREDICTED: uncharacterized protein LOC109580296 [Amphimedon queenslandica]|eukprot:XP_019848895.1 PREDICTED: uncharacterized protein LOC109580296 [Amphimedon queenslandica]